MDFGFRAWGKYTFGVRNKHTPLKPGVWVGYGGSVFHFEFECEGGRTARDGMCLEASRQMGSPRSRKAKGEG